MRSETKYPRPHPAPRLGVHLPSNLLVSHCFSCTLLPSQAVYRSGLTAKSKIFRGQPAPIRTLHLLFRWSPGT